MKKEMYEKHITSLEETIKNLKNDLYRVQTEKINLEKTISAKRGNMLKEFIFSLNLIYGKLGEIQGNILSQLNRLNNENLDVTNMRMEEALKVIQELIPTQDIS